MGFGREHPSRVGARASKAAPFRATRRRDGKGPISGLYPDVLAVEPLGMLHSPGVLGMRVSDRAAVESRAAAAQRRCSLLVKAHLACSRARSRCSQPTRQ